MDMTNTSSVKKGFTTQTFTSHCQAIKLSHLLAEVDKIAEDGILPKTYDELLSSASHSAVSNVVMRLSISLYANEHELQRFSLCSSESGSVGP